MNRGAWWAIVQGHKELDMTEWLSNSAHAHTGHWGNGNCGEAAPTTEGPTTASGLWRGGPEDSRRPPTPESPYHWIWPGLWRGSPEIADGPTPEGPYHCIWPWPHAVWHPGPGGQASTAGSTTLSHHSILEMSSFPPVVSVLVSLQTKQEMLSEWQAMFYASASNLLVLLSNLVPG